MFGVRCSMFDVLNRISDETTPPPFPQDPRRLLWRAKDQQLWLEPWGPDSIRVRATVLAEMPLRDWSLLPAKPSSPKIKIDAKNNSAQLINGRLTATIDE